MWVGEEKRMLARTLAWPHLLELVTHAVNHGSAVESFDVFGILPKSLQIAAKGFAGEGSGSR